MMKNNLRKVLALALCLTMLAGIFAMSGIQAAAEIVDSGRCGANLTWTLDSDGKLIISGTGAMREYDSFPPWESSSVKSVEIGSGVTTIGGRAFSNCYSLRSISVPSSITSIGDYAFYSCRSLRAVEVPSSVTRIGSHAFESCYNLYTLDLKYGLETIGSSAFYNCYELRRIDVPASVTSIGSYAFYRCCGMNGVTINSNIGTISDGMLENSSVPSFVIPEGVSSIGYEAFRYNYDLTSVTIPNTVKQIGEYAFAYTGLKNVTIPGSVKNIGANAFGWCESLTNVVIQNGLESIGGYYDGYWWGDSNWSGGAFQGCKNLRSITLPVTLENIATKSFYGCDRLDDIYYAGTEAGWNNVYKGSDNNALQYAYIHYGGEEPPTEEPYYPPYEEETTDSYTSYEPWNGGSSTRIYSGDTRTAYVNGGRLTYFRFTPSYSGNYVFSSSSSSDTYAYLYNSWGSQITSDDDGGSGNNFRISRYLYAGDTYYFGVRFYSSSTSGSFNVSLSAREEASSEDPYIPYEEETTDYYGSYEPWNGGDSTRIYAGETRYAYVTGGRLTFFRFTPAHSGYYTMTSSTGQDTYGCLYNRYGTQLSSDDDGGSNSNFLIKYYLNAGQTYYYGVRFYNSGYSGGFNVKLTDNSVAPEESSSDYYEEPASEESTDYYYGGYPWSGGYYSDIYSGGSASARVTTDYPYGMAWYRFIPMSTGRYTFESKSDKDTYGYLYNRNGSIMKSDDDSGDGANFRITAYLYAGSVYYYGVRLYTYAIGSANVTVRLTSGSTPYEPSSDAENPSAIDEPTSQPEQPPVSHTEHEWDDGTVVFEATCTSAGLKMYTCGVCGATRVESIPALGHDFSTEWTVDREANCALVGVKSHHCTRCDVKADETVIPITDHSWSGGEEVIAATCTANGLKTYTCAICGNTKNETIPALGHEYSTYWVIDTESTCSVKGTKSHHCVRCDAKKDVTETELAAHRWGSAAVIIAASCASDGMQMYTCENCGATRPETIRALGHNYVTRRTEATCIASGLEYRECTRCSAMGTVVTIPALGHTDMNTDGVCDRCMATLSSSGAVVTPTNPDGSNPDSSSSAGSSKSIWQRLREFFAAIRNAFRRLFS